MSVLPEWASWATQDTFTPYTNGFLEITNPYQSYIYCGEIAKVTLSDAGDLKVRFKWQAVGVDAENRRSQAHEGGWVKMEKNDYGVTLFTLPDPRIPDDYTRVYFKRMSINDQPLKLFGGPILEDMLSFYLPGTPTRVTPEDLRPADPQKPVNEEARYLNGPPGGGGPTVWEVSPDGKQFRRKSR